MSDDAAKNPAPEAKADAQPPFPVPPAPEGYHFDYSPARLTTDSTSLAQFSSELRGALHAAQVPAIFAQSVLDALDASAALYPATMTDVERVAVFQEEGWKLRRAFGEDGAKEIGELASAAWQRLPEAWRTKVDAQFGFHTAQGQAALAAIEREYRHRTRVKS
ncbi:MAG TPA: hypothetical protein VHD59_06880 [Pseudolabrys sp.]|nr:hypothetical protein [Pseudolabrys sp.]